MSSNIFFNIIFLSFSISLPFSVCHYIFLYSSLYNVDGMALFLLISRKGVIFCFHFISSVRFQASHGGGKYFCQYTHKASITLGIRSISMFIKWNIDAGCEWLELL